MAMGNNKRRRSSVGQTESTISKKSKNKKSNNSGEKAATIIKREKCSSSDGEEVLLRRPKVYITDISNFKTLVQELTGNGALGTATAIVTVANDPVNHTPPVSSQSESDSVDTFSPAADSSSETASFGPDEMMMMINNSFLYGEEEMACKTTSSDDHYDLAAWDDLEALMQDMEDQDDQFPLFESSNLQGSAEIHHCYEEDLSIYDYDFSGIVC